MDDLVHIVCLDAPSPPDYGGAIDMYYKIISLAATGKKIVLHYFGYNKKRNADGLVVYCAAIHKYPRSSFLNPLSPRPYIVRSRVNRELIDRLNQDNHPIILEGVHCSGIIPFLHNRERVVVRMHNDEESYYKNLSLGETNFFKKTYYALEAMLLRKYTRRLQPDTKLACISQSDLRLLSAKHFTNLYFIPAFTPWQAIRSKEGKGEYCLYHGNMSVSENEHAAIWLIKNVFAKTNRPFIVAGKMISSRLRAAVQAYPHISLVTDPSTEEMNALIQNAQVNILPSMNTTGVKLKILHALFEGRFCITNAAGILGSNIGAGVMTAENSEAYIELIEKLFQKNFTEEDKKNRQQLLSVYNNSANAEKLAKLL